MAEPATDVDLPRALIKRIVKNKLAELAGDDSKDFNISKDALTALSESTKVFISFIASTANDICQEKRRQTVNADDVLTALQDLDFPELVGPLREQLEAFKEAVKERNKNRPAKKRKNNAFEEPLVLPRPPKLQHGHVLQGAGAGQGHSQGGLAAGLGVGVLGSGGSGHGVSDDGGVLLPGSGGADDDGGLLMGGMGGMGGMLGMGDDADMGGMINGQG